MGIIVAAYHRCIIIGQAGKVYVSGMRRQQSCERRQRHRRVHEDSSLVNRDIEIHTYQYNQIHQVRRCSKCKDEPHEVCINIQHQGQGVGVRDTDTDTEG